MAVAEALRVGQVGVAHDDHLRRRTGVESALRQIAQRLAAEVARPDDRAQRLATPRAEHRRRSQREQRLPVVRGNDDEQLAGSDLKLYIVQLRVKQRSHGRDVVFHGNNIYLF